MPNHVHQLKRAHAKTPGFTTAGVQRGAISTALGQHPQRFGVIGTRHPIDDKPGRRFGLHRRLTPGNRRGEQGICDLRSGGQSRDHFHQGHQRCRVEKVQTDQALRTLQCTADGGNGNRRGVARQNAVGRHHGFQVTKELLLDLQILDNRFDHQGRIAQVTQTIDRDQPRTGVLRRLSAPFAFGRQLVKLGPNAINGMHRRTLAVVEQAHGVTRSGSHLRDAGTHGPGTHDANHALR